MSSSQGRLPAYEYPVRASRDHVGGPRSTAERVDAPRVVHRQRSPPRRPRDDDYPTRPRVRTHSLEPGEPSSRRPLSMINPRSPNKMSGPVITRGNERPSSPVSKTGGAQLEASYIMPASSSSGRNHHRHSSLTTGELLPVRERDRERVYPAGRGSRDMRPPPPRSGRDERDYAYEYTNPKEEVLRDLAPPQRRPRRESYSTSARPTSMINLDRSDKIYPRAERDAPPPASSKAFEDLDRRENLRQGGRARDDDLSRRGSLSRGYPPGDRIEGGRYRDIPRSAVEPREEYVPYPSENSRHQRPRKPTIEDERLPPKVWEPRDDRHVRDERPPPKVREPLDDRHDRDERLQPKIREPLDDRSDRDEGRPRRHHHHHRDPEPRRDYDEKDERERRRDYDDRERRIRDEPRERRDRGEEPGSHDGLLAAGGAATATSVAAEGLRRYRHRDRDDDLRGSKDAAGYPPSTDRDPGIPPSEDEDREERRRRRRREREREDREYREAREESQRRALDEGSVQQQRLEAPPLPEQKALREQRSYERRSQNEEQPRRPRRRRHRRRHRPRTPDADSFSESSESSSGSDSSSDRTHRAPRVVTPSNDSTDPGNSVTVVKPAPKGILKPPREKFPEEPSTVREGVAPLDAAKKGIPPEARWTRINRRLVNPEALEQEGVRFEEFPDHVIVLKVLNQDEIARYTQRTHEIRERRRLTQGSEGSGSVAGGASEAGAIL